MESEHDYEALGREAVRLGMPWLPGMVDEYGIRVIMADGERLTTSDLESEGSYTFRQDVHVETFASQMGWPDFCDELTALACIPWVRSVAREVYGEVDVIFHYYPGGVDLSIGDGPRGAQACHFDECHPTLPHACISAVRAMRGEG